MMAATISGYMKWIVEEAPLVMFWKESNRVMEVKARKTDTNNVGSTAFLGRRKELPASKAKSIRTRAPTPHR